MEILPLVVKVLEIVGFAFALLGAVRLGAATAEAAIGLVNGAVGYARRRRAPLPVAYHPPEWPVDWALTLSLLVGVDEGEGVIRPSVQVRGYGEPHAARIRLELVDPDGEIRLTLKRGFPAGALNKQLSLPPFTPPPGAGIDEVLSWRWDIVLSSETSELRWRERPAPAGTINAEAELDQGGVERVEPLPRRFGEGPGDLEREGARRRLVLRKRAKRLLLAIVSIAYLVAVYSGPTGTVSAIRALLLYGAFAAIWLALWALGTALFAEDSDLVPESRAGA